eukprot:3343636-Prorocentrum_lima.AAC.1
MLEMPLCCLDSGFCRPMLLKAQRIVAYAHSLPVCTLSDYMVVDALLDSRLSTFASSVMECSRE